MVFRLSNTDYGNLENDYQDLLDEFSIKEIEESSSSHHAYEIEIKDLDELMEFISFVGKPIILFENLSDIEIYDNWRE